MRYYAQQKEMERLMRSVPKITELPFEKKDEDDKTRPEKKSADEKKVKEEKEVTKARRQQVPTPPKVPTKPQQTQSRPRPQVLRQQQQTQVKPKPQQTAAPKPTPKGSAPVPGSKMTVGEASQAKNSQSPRELGHRKSMKSMFQLISQKISWKKSQHFQNTKHIPVPAVRVA